MATVSRDLPDRPHIDVPKREARELLKDWRAKSPEALDRIRRRHPRFREADDATVSTGKFLLNDAQLVIGRVNASAFQELKRYTVAKSATWAQPVISGNRVFVKDVSSLAMWALN